MIGGVTKVVTQVEDQEQATAFWTETLGFELARTPPTGRSGGWRCPRPTRPRSWSWTSATGSGRPRLPTSNVCFYAEDRQHTYEELAARRVAVPLAPVRQPFGWWSLFEDPDGNRFALVSRHWPGGRRPRVSLVSAPWSQSSTRHAEAGLSGRGVSPSLAFKRPEGQGER